ncbi:MAG: hypothetical protein ACKOBM_11210, partial [Gammaproteobacteria bacterium]
HPWYRKRVALRCRETEVEIGGFLRNEEVDTLVTLLRRMINQLDQLPPSPQSPAEDGRDRQ